MQAGQEQLQADVDKLRANVNALLVIGLYSAALALLSFLVLRYGAKIVPGGGT